MLSSCRFQLYVGLYAIESKNIPNYRFQQRQHILPNFMTDGIINFIHSKHNRDNLKLRIFLFIPHRQRIQPKFVTDSIRNFIHTMHYGDNEK